MLIKYILLLPLVGLIALFMLRLRNKTFYRLFLICVALIGVFFVLNPDATTRLANLVGVGRGTDLILYLCVIAFFLAFMVLYAKVRNLEAAQTEMVRQVALANAKQP
jgi:hypothetical protein